MEDINVKVDETNQLIASNKVEGTAVYNRDGDRLGSVYNFMVDKHSGKVEYVVMSLCRSGVCSALTRSTTRCLGTSLPTTLIGVAMSSI